jgi:hypothetical protein
LAKKLKEEHAFELENQEGSDWIHQFKADSKWAVRVNPLTKKIKDPKGEKEVSLFKTFGKEK